MQANNPVYGISNYVDVVPSQNQVTYLDPSQMFTLQQQQQVQQQAIQQQQTPQQQANTTTTPSTTNQTSEMSLTANQQHSMMQQTMVPQGMAIQQMMPQSMIISNGVGGFIQYPQMQTPFFPQMAQVGGMQMILQPTLQLRHAKPVGRTHIPRNPGISGSQSTGIGDQSGAGKVKKKKPSPSARRRSRLRLIAFLEAKRKKAEEEGIKEEGTLEQIKALEKEQALEDAQMQAANSEQQQQVTSTSTKQADEKENESVQTAVTTAVTTTTTKTTTETPTEAVQPTASSWTLFTTIYWITVFFSRSDLK